MMMMMMMYIQYDGNHQLGNDEDQNLLVPSRAAKALMAALEKKQREESVSHFSDISVNTLFNTSETN